MPGTAGGMKAARASNPERTAVPEAMVAGTAVRPSARARAPDTPLRSESLNFRTPISLVKPCKFLRFTVRHGQRHGCPAGWQASAAEEHVLPPPTENSEGSLLCANRYPAGPPLQPSP